MKMCRGSWLRRWFEAPFGFDKCFTEMVELERHEWPDKVFRTPLVTTVYRCPVCKRLHIYTDYPGPL